MKRNPSAESPPSDPLASLLTLQAAQARWSHLFPSVDSLRWQLKKHREMLIAHEAVFVIAGRIYLHPERFPAACFVLGAEAATKRVPG